MKNTKLIRVLSTLTAKEWRRFGDYVNSPFHNKNDKLIRYYRILDLIYPEFESSKQQIFKQMFPALKYDDLKIRHINSRLLKLVEAFLITLYTDQTSGEFDLLQLYRERELERIWISKKKRLAAWLDSIDINGDLLQDRFKLIEEQSDFIAAKGVRSNEPMLQEVSDQLDINFIYQKLKLFCRTINYTNLVKFEYDLQLKEEIITLLEQGKFDHVPLINIYHTIFKMLTEDDSDNWFSELKERLERRIKEFEKK